MPDESNPVRNIGRVQKFVVGTNFEAYAEQLEFFFVANGVTDPKQKKAVLLTNLPTETYQLAKDLVAPTLLREDSLTYDMIVEHLQKQLKPQKSALVARYEFDNRARNAGETVGQYVAVLKHLATECKFNEAMRLERLRDRLVLRIRDKKMMSELLKLKLEELTFDIAVVKCIAIEQSYKDVEALQGGKESNLVDLLESDPVDLLSQSRPDKKLQPKREAKPPEKKFPSHKSLLSKVATAVWAIMTIRVVHTKGKDVTTVTRPVIFKGPVKPRKGRHRVPDPQLITWTVMMETVMTS